MSGSRRGVKITPESTNHRRARERTVFSGFHCGQVLLRTRSVFIYVLLWASLIDCDTVARNALRIFFACSGSSDGTPLEPREGNEGGKKHRAEEEP